jgi:hypothetical protein
LGGFVILPRMLDKCRAVLAGKAGEYHYACPLDQQFLEFSGVDPEALKRKVAEGASDTEVLEWVRGNAKPLRNGAEIAAWSAWQEQRAPGDLEDNEYLHGVQKALAPKRDDIVTWFDMLDLDDFASYGGKP